MRSQSLALFLAGVAVTLASGMARADLIVNGGFETGNFSGWTVNAGATAVQPAGGLGG